jgi:hypothetical protein
LFYNRARFLALSYLFWSSRVLSFPRLPPFQSSRAQTYRPTPQHQVISTIPHEHTHILQGLRTGPATNITSKTSPKERNAKRIVSYMKTRRWWRSRINGPTAGQESRKAIEHSSEADVDMQVASDESSSAGMVHPSQK